MYGDIYPPLQVSIVVFIIPFFFPFPCKLKNHFVGLHKVICCDFDWDYIKSVGQIGITYILAILSLPTHKCGTSIKISDFFHQSFIGTVLKLG